MVRCRDGMGAEKAILLFFCCSSEDGRLELRFPEQLEMFVFNVWASVWRF